MLIPLVMTSRCFQVSVICIKSSLVNTLCEFFLPPAAAREREERAWGHPIPRQGDCVPLHPLLLVVNNGAFDLFDQVGYMDTARAGIGAVEDGTAAPYAFLLAQDGEAFGPGLVATVEDEAVSIHDGSRANPVGIAPDRRTGACTGATKDALGAFVIASALFRALQALRAGLRVVGDKIGFDRFVLGKKLVLIDNQVLDDWEAKHGLDGHLLAHVTRQDLAGQAIAAVDTHGIRTAHAVRTRAAIRQRAILRPLDSIQCIQQAIDRVGLDAIGCPVRFTVFLGVVAFDTYEQFHITTP